LIPRPEGRDKSSKSFAVELLVSDAQDVCDKLKRKGVEFIKELHEETWGGKQATFKDPDGNILEVTQIDWKKYFEVSAKGAQRAKSRK
jgi:uncharacterized glyoxalase superfamily protein PhnB